MRIHCGQLFDGTSVRRDVTLEIEDRRISRVAQGAAGTVDLDLGDETVLPGLIDCHVHLMFNNTMLPGPDAMRLSPEQRAIIAFRNAQQALAAGLTTVRDAGSMGTLVFALRDAIKAGQIAGPRILACGSPVSTTGGHAPAISVKADDEAGVRAAVLSQVEAGADAIKILVTGGAGTPGSNPVQSQYSRAELSAAVEVAHAHGRRVAAHLHATNGIRDAVAAGVDTFEHCSWLGSDGGDYDPEVAAEMARRGMFAVVTPGASYRFAHSDSPEVDPAARETAIRLKEASQGTIARMMDAGVKVATGSDAGTRMNPIDDFVLNLEIMTKALGIAPERVLKAATATAAEALGLEDQVGRIEPGMIADLVAVRGNPLENVSRLRRPRLVLRDGRVLAADGRVAARLDGAPEPLEVGHPAAAV